MGIGFTGFLGKMYEDGQAIFHQGETGDCMFLVQEGKVELLQRKGEMEFCLAVLDKGEYFGEKAIFGQAVRTATARSLGVAFVLSVKKKDFLSSIHHDPSLAFNMLKKMSARIEELEAQLVRYGELA
ncbi:MAG: Crp/Fnr family transcriptional regulator [Deltaproteobacteria bacterium]